MTTNGKTFPVLARAFSRSRAKRSSSSATSPPRTTCFDIFSPPPGDSEVISHVDRLSSNETKIAPRSVRIAVGASGRSATVCMVASRVGGSNLTLPKCRSPSTSPWDLFSRSLPFSSNTWASFSTASRLQAAIWVGCSSCLVASSAIVSWPLIAASATLALNSAENRLRVLMVVHPLRRRIHLSPLSQELGPPLFDRTTHSLVRGCKVEPHVCLHIVLRHALSHTWSRARPAGWAGLGRRPYGTISGPRRSPAARQSHAKAVVLDFVN